MRGRVVVSVLFGLLLFSAVFSFICIQAMAEEVTYMPVVRISEELELEVHEMTEEELEEEHYYDSLELLAICTMAEAEGESELGKRLVIDTILNRVDSYDFPNNIWDVITQPNAFTSYTDGRMDKVAPTEEIFRLVTEELENRTNREVLYFNTGNYSKYGTPLFKEDNHYFSGR